MKRKPMSNKQVKKTFSKGNKVNSKNLKVRPMRGGFRL